MKRISFILACLMILSFGLVNGQQVTISSVTGLVGTDTIGVGPVTFNMSFQIGPTNTSGLSNGFKVYSTDGATWVATTVMTPANALTLFPEMNGGMFTSVFSGDGALEDTAAIGGFAISGTGVPAGAIRNAALISITPTLASDGKTICIDSAWYPPGGDWVWADAGGSVTCGWYAAPKCYTVYNVPDQCPVAVNPLNLSFNHCALATHTFTATDAEAGPITFEYVSGPGSITAGGVWSYNPTIADVGTNPAFVFSVTDAAHGAGGCPTTYSVNLSFTNVAPAMTAGCGDAKQVGKGNSTTLDFDASSGDCDPISYSILSVVPAPVGSYSINSTTGVVTFNSAEADCPTTFVFTVQASDGVANASCSATIEVLCTEPFSVLIEKTHMTYQGMHELVDVSLVGGSEAMGGFDFLISYDATALNLSSAIPGADFYAQSPAGCGWEYFTYRFSAFGNCGNACASGKVRVVGIAETNNGPNHPDCFLFPNDAVMFSLDFLVTDNRTFECQYVPVRFVWFDCGDNTISSQSGDSLFISRKVYDFDNLNDMADFTASGGYPTFQGAQDADCFAGTVAKAPIRFIDFQNGGIDIACADSIDARGDINLNEISNEIADAVLYSRYFIFGLGVFTVNLQGQIAASDVNADGFTLSVADLVYLIRIVVGDAAPYAKLAPVAANVTTGNGLVTVDGTMGAALIVVEGNQTPTLLANHMEMQSNFDGSNTRILVWSQTGESFSGEFVKVDGNVTYTEFASAQGAPVVVSTKLVPSSFSLNQNYPNPFNASTNISFGMPKAGDYTIAIYNVTGQVVREIAGAGNAGENFVTVDMSGEASGVYFYKLNASNFSNTKKMIYLK
ncbi:MAG: T9SS type A sorting domain-containing protein [Candidatus Zixiibacteriota bacterium]